MLLLTGTSDLIQVVTSGTAAIDVQASWIDNAAGAITPGRTNTAIASATTTTVVGSPASSTQRALKSLSLRNKDASASNTITVKHTDGSTAVELIKLTLSAGEELLYTEGCGWTYYTTTGAAQVTQAAFATAAATSAAPTGNVSTTEKAMGLAFAFTPTKTGNLLVWIAGVALNATAAGDGTSITGRFGTGTAPVNGATSGLGTGFGLQQHFIASTTAGQQGFMCMGKITGQTLNTALWFDLSLLAVTGGGSTVKDVQFMVMEVP
jgi:hypothetical protein